MVFLGPKTLPLHIDMILAGQVTSMSEVQAFADAKGGEDAVREAQANGVFGQPGSLADANVERWFREIESKRQHALVMQELEIARLAAMAAERAARWAMWTALIALLTVAAPIIKDILRDLLV